MQFNNLDKYRVGGTNSYKELAIPLPKTPDGRVYRYSPNEKAHPRHFVLGEVQRDFVIADEARKRMKLPPRSKQTVCPYSGTIADDQAFTHPKDKEAALEVVKHAALADVSEAVHDMFRGLERKFSSGPITIRTSGAPSHRPRPHFWRRDLLRELVCDHCGRDYGVFAIGLFCPDCGAPNLKLHFAREVSLVSEQVALADAQQDNQELAYRLMGNAHEDVLTAFEATLKTVYLYGIEHLANGAAKPPRNDFQNIEKTQTRFSELTLDPFSVLTSDELEELNVNIQKRHIIGHNLSVMDEKFSDYASNAKLGETVHLVGADIVGFAALARRVIDALDDWLVTGSASNLVSTSAVPLPAKPENSENGEFMERLRLSEIAVRVGKWIASNSVDGLERHIDIDKLIADFSDVDIKLLEEGVVELEMGGYAKISRPLSCKIPYTSPTVDLYAAFDPIIGNNNPIADSKMLAEQIISRESIDIPAFQQEVGWPLRRFNPAIGLVIGQFNDKHVLRELIRDYPARGLHIAAEDRIRLRRYIEKFSS